jgi:uncharacterized protein YbjT (DUF2867 family)
MKSKSILVVGASGIVGSEIVKLLLDQGHKVRGTTSKKSLYPLSKAGFEKVYANLETGEGVHNAFEGIDRAFLLSPPGYVDQYAILSPLIQAAKNWGLEKIVLMTALGVNHNEASPFRKTEIKLESSGIPFNIVRPNWFMQNFNTFWLQGILEKNKILLPAGQAKASFIDARDISAVAAKLLISDDKNNTAFDITGLEGIDHNKVANIISKVTKKDITYEEISPSTLKEQLLASGLKEDYTNFIITLLEYLRNGFNASVTNTVKEILGREPIGIQKYAEDYRNCWL